MTLSLKRRRLGRTGLMVAELGLGAMDTPFSPDGPATLAAAVDAGIDFVDTAREYAGSEALIGELVRTRGDAGFHIASKTFSRTINGSQWDIDRSLTVLGVGQIDLYQLHDVSTPAAWEQVMAEGGALEGLRAAQSEGRIGHIGVSSHNTELLRDIIASEAFDTVMLEYSAFFPETAPLIDLAASLDIGVIAMRPVGGSGRTSVMRGRIAGGYDGLLTPANLLRYVLSNPGVSVAIPGARHPSRIDENVATALAYDAMDPTTRKALEAEAAQLY